MNKSSSTALAILRPTPGTSMNPVGPQTLIERMDRLYAAIERRAFELFERDGRVEGRDVDHWLEAERELLHPVHLRVEETGAEFLVFAEVPGFTANDIEVNVEPNRLTITGKRESKEEKKNGKAVYAEVCSDEIFRSVQLPSEVNTGKVTATLKHGILEVHLPIVTEAGATLFPDEVVEKLDQREAEINSGKYFEIRNPSELATGIGQRR